MSASWNYQIKKHLYSWALNSELWSEQARRMLRVPALCRTASQSSCDFTFWIKQEPGHGHLVREQFGWVPLYHVYNCKWGWYYIFKLEDVGIMGVVSIHINSTIHRKGKNLDLHMKFTAAFPDPKLELINNINAFFYFFFYTKPLFWKQKACKEMSAVGQDFMSPLPHFCCHWGPVPFSNSFSHNLPIRSSKHEVPHEMLSCHGSCHIKATSGNFTQTISFTLSSL